MHSIQSLKAYEATSRLRRLSWKSAFRSVFDAASRVHRYRDLQTGMMREVFKEVDCGNGQRGNFDE